VQAVQSELYPLQVTTFRGFVDARVWGGGIASLGDGYLAASGEGYLFHIRRDSSALGLESLRLKVSVPINHEEFFRESTQTDVTSTWFRVTDLLVEEADGSTTLFAVHNHWNHDQRCSVLRVSMLSAPTRDLIGNRPVADWQTLYDAGPCQDSVNEGQGGRLVRLPERKLLLSTGVQGTNDSAQDPANSYGKTVMIDVMARQGRIFTSGHRNPQGLAVASTGDIWLTEHGPNGGDELNRLVSGANFGWPVVSYGLPYSPGEPPFGDVPGSHEGFDRPAFAWMPSIGISNLIEVKGGLLPNWRHDLIIASLVRTTLWRARVVDQRVEYVEEIKLDERIRDIIEDPAGRIVLWTDNQSLVFIEPLTGDAGTGSRNDALLADLAFSRCAACHVTAKGAANGIGPNLHEIMGRPVASAAGYGYSKALRGVGGVWDEERLDRFLEDPQAFAPGARLEMQPMPNASQRRRVITYLKASGR
jgi:cytochrome c2